MKGILIFAFVFFASCYLPFKSRRQKQGNTQQYHILLNTLVLTEKGAVMELLDQNTEVFMDRKVQRSSEPVINTYLKTNHCVCL